MGGVFRLILTNPELGMNAVGHEGVRPFEQELATVCVVHVILHSQLTNISLNSARSMFDFYANLLFLSMPRYGNVTKRY